MTDAPTTPDMGDPRNYRELVHAMGEDIEAALIDCICAATGIHPDDFDRDDERPLYLLVERLRTDYANRLTDDDRLFLIGQLATMHLPINLMTVALTGGKQVFICKTCRQQVEAEMNQPWTGHRPDCAHQRRVALMQRIDPDLTTYLIG